MKIAMCQMKIVYENKEANIRQAEEYIKEAAAGQADIILFPEMSMTGFSMLTDYTSESKTRTVTLNKFREFAKRYKINIGLGWVAGMMEDNVVNILAGVLQSHEDTMNSEKSQNRSDKDMLAAISEIEKSNRIEHPGTTKLNAETVGEALSDGININTGSIDAKLAENHYTIISPEGEILADYIKIHPFSYADEDSYFACGNKVVHFDIAGIPCSNFICYDLRFPEIFQAVSDKAHVIFIPAEWPKDRIVQWKMLLSARAIENQCYLVGVNCLGNQDDLVYTGESCLVNPYGVVVAEAHDREGILMVEIEDDVEAVREHFSVRKDRRPDLYAQLMEDVYRESTAK